MIWALDERTGGKWPKQLVASSGGTGRPPSADPGEDRRCLVRAIVSTAGVTVQATAGLRVTQVRQVCAFIARIPGCPGGTGFDSC
jgi:hypothetical protein